MNALRSALRTLARSPGFTLTAVATLAAGIAANTTVLTLLYGLALRPIPAPAPDRLVRVYPLGPDGRRENLFRHDDYVALRPAAQGLRELVAYIPLMVTLSGRSSLGSTEPREALAYVVSGNYFQTLGAIASIGRTLRREDDSSASGDLTATISDRLWQRIGRRPDVLGQPLVINSVTFTIVGVVPSTFVGTEPLAPDVWVPLSAARHLRGEAGGDAGGGVLLVARLDDEVRSETVEAQLSAVMRAMTRPRPAEQRSSGVTLRRATFFPIDRDPLAVGVLVMLVTALLLAVTAANVTNLLLARAVSRRREIAVRLAIGASRARLVRQLLLESLCVALASGAIGLMASTWALSALAAIALPRLPFQWGTVILDLAPDARIFAYTFGLSLVATLVIGLAPALQATRLSLNSALHGVPPVFARGRRPTTRTLMVCSQVAIALALAIVAGLLGRAARRADALDLGFMPGRVLTSTYDFARHGYTAARAAEYSRRLAEQATASGVIASATLASHVPLTGGLRATRVWSPERGERQPPLITRYVFESGGYFRVLGIPLVRGRDVASPPGAGRHEAVVSEVLAGRLWPGVDPLGARVRTGLSDVEYEVVGIARDTRASSLWRDKESAVYLSPATEGEAATMRLVAVARSEGAATALARLARRLEPDVTFSVTPLADAVALWTLPSRAASVASAGIAIVALLVASLGLYGVLAHLLAQQTREFGIRHALGATGHDLIRESLGRGLRLVVPGIVAGVLVGQALARAIGAFLYDLSPSDALTYAVAVLVVSCTSLAACYVPARRAARVDPMTVLRRE
jgi:predicted permease